LAIITGNTRVDRVLERNQPGALRRAPGGRGRAGDVRVARGTAKPGEVLDHRHDPARPQSVRKRETVVGGDPLVRAE
jgi:hypothetical protein